jgi:hypothetical protein
MRGLCICFCLKEVVRDEVGFGSLKSVRKWAAGYASEETQKPLSFWEESMALIR